MESNITFGYKPVSESDLLLIHEWLDRPHIAEWIHGQGLQNTLNGLKKFISGQPTSGTYWIAYLEGEPFAFLISAHRNATEPELESVSVVGNHIVGIDIFIGDVNMTGKGLGTKLIKDFLLSNFKDATDFLIDPEASNSRAIHVYEKVGFRIVGEFIAPWHPVKHYLMHVPKTLLEVHNVTVDSLARISHE